MNFEWDENKRWFNIKKHGIDFADAVEVFYDDWAVSIPDSEHYDEERFIIIGVDAQSRVLVVIHTFRSGDTIRIISARKADRKERKQYEG